MPRDANPRRLFADGFLEAGDGVLQRLHFRQREQEGQRGLGALILAQTVHVQAVPTAAGGRIVERQAQIVSTEEPLERAPRLRDPEHVARRMIRFDAGGNRYLGFDGLLVELRAFLAARIKSRSEERRVGKECRSRWSP